MRDLKKTLFFKIFFSFAGLCVFLLFFVFVFSFSKIKQHYLTEQRNNLTNIAYALANDLTGQKDQTALKKYLTDFEKKTQVRVTLIDQDGKVLLDSQKDAALMENHADRPEFAAAKAGKPGQALRYSETLKKEMLYVTLLLPGQETVLRVGLLLSDIELLLSSLKKELLEIFLMVILLALLLAGFIVKGVSLPAIKQETANLKRDFVANASHELRTPLTAIKGYVETLLEELSGQPHEYLQIIKNNTERLSNIVEDLLTISYLEESQIKLEKSSVFLPQIIDNVRHIFEQKLKNKNLFFAVNIEPGLPALLGDSFMLEQVFINLIDNAIKYTEKGGVTINFKKQSKGLLVEVCDTGIGIPPAAQTRIFERFFVVDKSRSRRVGGTGLGLSIVKHIVQLHQGTIAVAANNPQGSVFSLWLPLNK